MTVRFGAIRYSSICGLAKPFTASMDSDSEPVSNRAATLRCSVVLVVRVHGLGDRRPCRGDIVCDRALEIADPVDLLPHIHQVQIQMLAPDQVDIVDRTRPRRT